MLLLRKERKTGNEQNWKNSEKDIDHLWVTLGKADSPRSSAEVEAVMDLDLEKQDQRERLWHRRSSDATLSKDGCASLFVVVVFFIGQI